MEITLNDLEACFNQAIRQGLNYVGIAVTVPDSDASEIIINRAVNFERKLKYYKEAYNDDLTHKYSRDIKITAFANAVELNQLVKDLIEA